MGRAQGQQAAVAGLAAGPARRSATVTVDPRVLNILVTCAAYYADPKLLNFRVGGGRAQHALNCYEQSDHTDGTAVPADTLRILLDLAAYYADPTLKNFRIGGGRARHALELAQATLTPFPEYWVCTGALDQQAIAPATPKQSLNSDSGEAA